MQREAFASMSTPILARKRACLLFSHHGTNHLGYLGDRRSGQRVKIMIFMDFDLSLRINTFLKEVLKFNIFEIESKKIGFCVIGAIFWPK